MNAVSIDPTAAGQSTIDRPRLLGLRNLIRKDLSEWVHSKRPWISAVSLPDSMASLQQLLQRKL